MNRAEEMRAALGRWEKSGLSLHAFAKREETLYSKLQYWRAQASASSKTLSAKGQFSLCPSQDFSETKPEWVKRTSVAPHLGTSSIRRMVSAPSVPSVVPLPVIHVISTSLLSINSRNRP